MPDNTNPIPPNWRSWYKPEAPEPAEQAATPAQGTVPDSWKSWYTPEAPEPPQPAASGDLADVGRNIATAVARVPGAILGAPAAVNHALNWGVSKVGNALTGANITADQLEKDDPVARALPTSQGVDNLVFGATGTTPYEPTSPLGKLGQAAVTGVGAGLADPLADLSALKNAGGMGKALLQIFKANAGNAAKTGLASAAANAVQQVDPDSDILPVAAAVLTHGGAGLAADTVRGGYGVVRPIFNPVGSAKTTAAKALAHVDSSLPGLADPSTAAIQGAIDKTKQATDALGDGESFTGATSGVREFLTGLEGNLKDVRDAAVEPAYAKFRAEQPIIPPNAGPITRIPAVRPAMNKAATDMLNGAGGGNPYGSPTTGWTDFNVAGDPIYKKGALTPDLLDRTKIKLNNQANQASDSLDTHRAAGLKAAAGRVTAFLDNQYPNTYPQARQAYADASTPLQPFETTEVSQALRQQTDRLGRPLGYAMTHSELFDRLAKGRDPGSVVGKFIDAAGAQDPVVKPIEQAIVGQLHDTGAINPQTGELDAKTFDRTIKPYLPTLSMYSPGLLKKFGTAKATQGTLDGLRAQEAVATDVKDGALRDTNGLVTQGSFSKWLDRNKDTLAVTQDPNTIFRLKQIAAALPRAPGSGAEAAVEGLPAAAGFMLGGSESGIFGAMFHKIPDWITGPRIQTFKDAYSKLIEDAVTDPNAQKELARTISTRPRGQTAPQALGQLVLKRAKASVAAAPLAVNASGFPNGQ